MFSKVLIDNQIEYYKYLILIPLFVKYFDGDITYHEYYSYNSFFSIYSSSIFLDKASLF